MRALGASTGNQAVQQVKAGLETTYVSGWQIAAGAAAGYFDEVAQVIAGGEGVATAALTGSTEEAQF